MSLMGRGIAEEALVLLRRRLCDLNFIFSLFSNSPDNNYSMLKFDPRGCGKIAVLDLVLEDLLKEYPEMILEAYITMADRKEHLLPPKPTSAINLYTTFH
ncbi:hypothetical protein Lser_V15G09436 [Lactuca serriola]